MIEESGRVVAIDGSEIWVETVRQSACGSCSAKSGCGQGLMAKFTDGKRSHIRLTSDQPVHLGDRVVMGIPEHTLVRSALLVYGFPLLLFVLAAGLSDSVFGLSELWVILVGFAGLLFGFFLVKFMTGVGGKFASFKPVILRILPE